MKLAIDNFCAEFSPYGQRTKLLLAAAGVDFKRNDQPVVLPRPDLEALGITYRRIPLLAIGKDVYVDSSLIMDTIQAQLGDIATSPADKAYEVWGNTVFQSALGAIPSAVLSDEFVKDRKTIFPMLTRPDYASLRPSSLATLKSQIKQIEEQFLAGSSGPFIAGEKISIADIHIIWPVRFAFSIGVDKEPGFGKDAFPKVHRLIENLPSSTPPVLSAEETQKLIREASYTSPGPQEVAKDDPLNMAAGTDVTIEGAEYVYDVQSLQAGKR